MCDKNPARIKEWIDFALQDYDLCNYHIVVEGQTSKGDGYSGDIHFVKVIGFDKRGDKKYLDLAIKSSKGNDIFKKQLLIREAYERESFIYNNVKTVFENFLKEKGVQELNDVIPYCYGSVLNNNSEVIIFENLRTQGFQLWDRKLPMTSKHTQLVLEAYGQWHAFSMALKVQKPGVFEKLIQGYTNMFSKAVVNLKLYVPIAHEFENARNLAINDNEQDILKYLQHSEGDVEYALTDMFFEEQEHRVILHGDCWNSNFLFKVSNDATNPSEVRVLDWQCSGLACPAFDLSHFIYSCVDNGKYKNVKELLEIYYKSFSKQLVLLECDPERVYSFDKLTEQWKKFSRFGLFVSCWGIRICLMNSNEIPDFGENVGKAEDPVEAFSFKFSDSVDECYVKRVRNNFLHYCNSLQM